jgi:hypothetical protein
VTATDLLQVAPQQDDSVTGTGSVADLRDGAMPFGRAVRALLEGTRNGGARAGAPGDRWLMLRIEEAIRGFDEIQQMAADDKPEAAPYASDTAQTLLVLAPRARAFGPVDSAA